MAVCLIRLMYLVKRDYVQCIGYTVADKEQVTYYKMPEKHGHVYLVGLYISFLLVLFIFQLWYQTLL